MRFKLNILLNWMRLKSRGVFTSREALEKYQHKRLSAYLSGLSDAPFYKKLNIEGMQDWPRIPVMNKDTLLANFDELNRPGITLQEAMDFALSAEMGRAFAAKLKGVTVGLSTGTSGRRGIFLASDTERAGWAAAVLSKVLKPKIFKKQKIAFFLRADSNLYSSVSSSLFGFSFFDIFKPMNELAVDLQQYQPDILAAQPAVLIELCRRQATGALKIAPRTVISFAEVLHQRDRETITRTFGVPLSEVYQCMEGFLGCTCPLGTMHLNEDLLFVEKEFIDDGRFYPIITDFSRSTQFIVRYRLDDILKIKKDGCACGNAAIAIECIEGRSDDVMLFFNRSGGRVKLYPDVLSRKISWLCDEFDRYRITQTELSTIIINIDCAAENYGAVCTLKVKLRIFTPRLSARISERRLSGLRIDLIEFLSTKCSCFHLSKKYSSSPKQLLAEIIVTSEIASPVNGSW